MARSDKPIFELSKHARRRMQQRGIRLRWIERALARPDRAENDRDDPEVRLAFKRIHEASDRILCVAYNDMVHPNRVVTVFFED